MNWFYAIGGQQQGPVPEAQLDSLLAAGTITPETLVWREGMPTWQPLRLARPAGATAPVPPPAAPPVVSPAAAAAPPGPDEVLCVECGRRFTRDNVIQYGPSAVCASCKPIFLQRLREGAAPSTATGTVSVEQLLARDYRIEVGDCLSRAWRLFSENAGIIIGVSLLAGLLFLVAGMLAAALGVVGQLALGNTANYIMPFVNQILMSLITGPIAGGYFWFLLKLARGEPAGVSDAFSGFSRRFAPLLLCSLAQGVAQTLFIAPLTIIAEAMGSGARGGGQPDAALVAAFAGSAFLTIIAVTYLTTVCTHAYFLIMDKNYNAWPALKLSWRMVHKRWWMTWVFLLVGTIIGGAGVLACCLGVLVTFPLFLAMRTWLYEDNFRDLARAAYPV